MVTVLDTEGAVLGNVPVAKVRAPKFADHALLVKVKAPREIAKRIAGIRVQEPWVTERRWSGTCERIDDDEIVCRCERVTAGEIRALIRAGVRDLNHLKAAHPRRHGRLRRQDLPQPHHAALPRGGRAAAEVTDLTQRPSSWRCRSAPSPASSPGQGPAEDAVPTPPTPTREACDEHRGLRRRRRRRRQRRHAHRACTSPSRASRPLSSTSSPAPGQGSNKAAIGGIRATHSTPAKIRLCLDSLRIFSTWKETHGDDIEWRAGRLHLRRLPRRGGADPQGPPQGPEERTASNIDWYDTRRAAGARARPQPARACAAAPSRPRTARPRRCSRACAFHRRAVELGVECRFGERVTGIMRRRGHGGRACAPTRAATPPRR